MAASQKQYSAVFSISARMLGSFRGVMAAAQKRLEALRHTAVHTGEGIMKIFERFGVGLSLFAGFAAGKIFQSIFEGASEEAIEADQRARQLSILLLQHNEIRKRGLGFAQRQTALIFRSNEELAKQGALGQDVLDTAAAQLSVFGYSPKKIAGMLAPLADVLVTMKGVTATQEDAASLANAWGRAVRTGMVKPMKEFGYVLDRTAAKKFAALSPTERNNVLSAWARGFSGANVAAAATAIGKIQKFHDEMKELSQDIGRVLLPAQAEMAAAWTDALPATKPAIIGTLKSIGHLAAWAGRQMKDFFNVLTPPQEAPKVAPDLFTSYSGLIPQIGRFNAVLGQTDQSFNATNDAANQYQRTGLAQLLDSFGSIQKAIEGLNPTMERSKSNTGSWGAWAAQQADVVAQKFAEMNESTSRDIQNFGKAWQAIQNSQWVQRIADNWTKSWSDLGKNLGAIWNDIKTAWDLVVAAWNLGKAMLPSVFADIGDSIKDYILEPIRGIQDAWSKSVDFIKSHVPTWAGGTPKAPVPATPSPLADVQGMATGGIIRGHSLLQVAERGPEAIIPLSGGARAEGLLNYASRAMGLGGVTNNRDVNVTLSSPITIQGNVGESELRTVNSQLRKRNEELIAGIKAATAHERRLSFDGAYS